MATKPGKVWRTQTGTMRPAQVLGSVAVNSVLPIGGDYVRRNGSSVQILQSGEGAPETPIYGICSQDIVDKLNVPGYNAAIQGGSGVIGQPAVAHFGGRGSRSPGPNGMPNQRTIIQLDATDQVVLDTVSRGLGSAGTAVDTTAVTAAIATISVTASTGAGLVGKICKIDNELIFVTSSTTATPDVMTVIRGYSGTTPAPHAVGTVITPLSNSGWGISTSSQTAAVSQTITLPVGQSEAFAAAGTLQIDNEQCTFTRSTVTLTLTARGQNGTTAATHAVGAIVTQILPDIDSGIELVTSEIASTDAKAGAVGDTIAVTLGTSFSIDGGRVMIDGELFDYGGVSSNTLTYVTRAVDGTVAAKHTVGAKVYEVAKVGNKYDLLRSAAGYYVVNVAGIGRAVIVDGYYSPDIENGVYPPRVWVRHLNIASAINV